MSANIDSDSGPKGRFVKIAKIASLVSLFSHSTLQSRLNSSSSTSNIQKNQQSTRSEPSKQLSPSSSTSSSSSSTPGTVRTPIFAKVNAQRYNQNTTMPEAPALTITVPNGREEKLKGSFRWLRGVSQRRKRKLQLQGTTSSTSSVSAPGPLKLSEPINFVDDDDDIDGDDYGFLSKNNNNHLSMNNNNNNNFFNNNNNISLGNSYVSCSDRLCTPHPYLKPSQSTITLTDKMKRASIYSTLSLESINSHLSIVGDSTHGDETTGNNHNNNNHGHPLTPKTPAYRCLTLTPSTMYTRNKAKSDTHLYYCITESPSDLGPNVSRILEASPNHRSHFGDVDDDNDTGNGNSSEQIFFGENFDIHNCQCQSDSQTDSNSSPATNPCFEAMPPTPIKRNTNRRTSLYARFLSAKKASAKQNSSGTLRSTRFKNRSHNNKNVPCQQAESCDSSTVNGNGNTDYKKNNYNRRMSDGAVLIRNSSQASRRRLSCDSQYNHDENGISSNQGLSSTDLPPRPGSRSSSSHKSLMRTIRKRFSFNKQRSKSVERQGPSSSSSSKHHPSSSSSSGDGQASGSGRRDPLEHDRARSVPPGSREPSIARETIINGKKQATSIMSLTSNASYYHDASTLAVECTVNGEIKHYVIKDNKSYRQLQKSNRKSKLTKLHLFADHVFTAVHAASSYRCDVCNKTFPLRLGKQAYKCRDCAFLTHKPCHVLVDKPCSANGASKLNFDFLEPLHGSNGTGGVQSTDANTNTANNGTNSGGRCPSPLPQVRVFTPPPDDLDAMIHYDEKRLV